MPSTPSSGRSLPAYLRPNAAKAIMESALVRKRDIEIHRQNYWDKAVKYFDKVETINDKWKNWNSEQAKDKASVTQNWN